ncbi:transglutaminaseTgpA domain-containing protein [Streptomyces sp. NPDC018031]|uniref:transglutaminase TgpA family protein n=1 Tax=Streptomyces sp. NPDC018031 TaxID=3365033 RepID=UPI0037970C9A
MSGRTRLAVCAALATLAASCALIPLVNKSGWILQAALLLAVQSAVGAAARRVPLARPLTMAAQLLATLLLVTVVFSREQAFAGLLPSPTSVEHLGRLVRQGADDVALYASPAPLTDGIRLLLIGGVLLIGLVVDALAVTYRSAAPAGLPLLALYSVAAGLSEGDRDWLWFLLAASGYLLLLLAEGRDRLSQWGRLFSGGGGGPRPPEGAGSGLDAPAGPALAPVRTGRRIGALALGIALAVPAVLPSLDGGLLDNEGDGPGKGGGGGTISAVNPLVSLQDSLNQPENKEVLRYKTTAERTQDMYLRILALDKFDGSTWKPSERPVGDVPPEFPWPAGLDTDIRTTRVNTTIAAAEWYAQDWLPMPFPATRVDIDGRWRFEPEGRTVVGDHRQTTRGVRYTVSSMRVQPTAGQLAAAPEAPPRLLREYTEVPDSLPPVVADTAREVTSGARNSYEQAVKLQDWFSSDGGFRYDTQVEAGKGPQAIANFLRQREGFCVHFSFTMAAMARTLGIPARVAVGFTPGTAQTDGTMSVGIRDAHAWPELYFEGLGWTRFEPTPSRGTQPDYTETPIPSEDPTEVPDPDPTTSDRPSSEPSAKESCPPSAKKLGDCDDAAPAGPTDDGSSGGWSWQQRSLVAAATLAMALLVLAPLLPMLWRLRVRARRLNGSAGRTPADAADRTLAAWHELTDSAWDHGVAPDDSQTPRRAVARIVRAGRLDPPTAEAAQRVAVAVEQVLYAPHPHPVSGLASDVRQVIAGLRAASDRRTRLRALLVPRSSVRLVWAASRRWSERTARWSASTARWTRWTNGIRRPGRQRG